MDYLKKKLKDAIYGFAIGDALGVPYEFRKRGSFNCVDMIGDGSWSQPKGTFSDDTSMTLATCKSIKENGKIVIEDIRKKFEDWCFNSAYTANGKRFDIGRTTYQAIMLKHGINYIYSNGNGSLMRILPLAFIPCTFKEIKEVSSITHAHDISIMACKIYVFIATLLIEERSLEEIFDLLKKSDLKAPFDRLPYIKNISIEKISSSSYVVDTLEAALWCLATTNTYEECVLKAVNLGDDTDTVAAIAGGLAGIKYGIENIPKKWIDNLINKELIEDCLFL